MHLLLIMTAGMACSTHATPAIIQPGSKRHTLHPPSPYTLSALPVPPPSPHPNQQHTYNLLRRQHRHLHPYHGPHPGLGMLKVRVHDDAGCWLLLLLLPPPQDQHTPHAARHTGQLLFPLRVCCCLLLCGCVCVWKLYGVGWGE